MTEEEIEQAITKVSKIIAKMSGLIEITMICSTTIRFPFSSKVRKREMIGKRQES